MEKRNQNQNELEILLRPEVRSLLPYESARSLYQGDWYFLDANELWESLTDEEFFEKINRYPYSRDDAFMKAMTRVYGVSADKIIADRGTDGVIDLILRAFARPGIDEQLTFPPTYGVYEIFGNVQGIKTQKITLTEDFQLPLQKIKEQFNEKIKIIWVCNPNNPTGSLMDPNDIVSLLDFVQNRAIVVVDEAYVEYTKTSGFSSLIDKYPNLVILRTLSKAFGLAGLRLGVGIAAPWCINAFRKVQAPYPLNVPTMNFIKTYITEEKIDEVSSLIDRMVEQREWLRDELAKLPQVLKVYPSETNFFLLKVKDAYKTFDHCVKHKLILRNRCKETLLDGCIRITVGNRKENELLLKLLMEESKLYE